VSTLYRNDRALPPSRGFTTVLVAREPIWLGALRTVGLMTRFALARMSLTLTGR
jgi:hypothetical protein